MWMVIVVINVWFIFKSFSVVIDEFAEWVRFKVQHRLGWQEEQLIDQLGECLGGQARPPLASDAPGSEYHPSITMEDPVTQC
ncbi:uncharacterized protein BDW47DRAFT_125884 [Aspergillus candidus]|uniref:Uncharacterized protein n=1 Tax=Aspergillus candidus TaxID=41067 RepID=A0A2I2FB71_ASPCN|nr:hypothetical protein BDW47DRAFT_125884 [Aspergillus candidus]PLB37895.1 hypothetical protein BDW47DRAFT_125884 [Aspergillus candidus]